MTFAAITATGSYLPEREVNNFELESVLDTTDEWVFSRTGIRSRRVAGDHESTSFMACEAARNALASSSLSPDDIDLIVVATCTPNHYFPSMACHVQHSLNIKKPIPAFDVGAACSGFMYALDVAKHYVISGAAKHVMVVGSESMSRAVDWTDRASCILFGDGAGAVILSASDKPGILGSVLHSAYDHEKLLAYPTYTHEDKPTLISMKGNAVFKMAVTLMDEIVDEVLTASHMQQKDINWLIPHQANIRIIQAIAKKLDLPMSQVIVTIENQGNTSAASIPLALDHSIKEQKIKRGDNLLLEAFGAGMTWGAMVIRY